MGWLLLDIAVILVLVLPCVSMAKKGIFKVLFNLTANIITIITVSVLIEPATEMVMNTSFGEKISGSISESISSKTSEISYDSEFFDFVPMIKKDLVKKGIEDTTENLNREITKFIVKVVTYVLLFLLIRILMSLLFMIINSVFKLPVISKMNMVAGGIVGLINGLLIIYIASAIIGLNFKWAEEIRLQIDDTFIYQHFYYNNVLIDLLIN